ncbi:MAG: iron-containing alcohol dehydrogenase [Phycisphaeraceae bacterium]
MKSIATTTSIVGFDHQARTRIVFGPDSVERIGPLAAEWDAKRVLLVTDPHIVQAGHAERLQASLIEAGIDVVLFAEVRENPTTDDVDVALQVAREAKVDTIVGLGGGSALDTAKGCNFLLTNGGTMHDYWGVGKATKAMLPLIAVPTTAGTGSECQSFALIADAKTHQKMACGDSKAAARVAVLDPKLTLTQPTHVTANTGIDTVTHAVEAAVTVKRNEMSTLYAREAFRLAQLELPRVLAEPDNLDARGRMQLAAAFAGTAIENSMLGAAHSAANPLTAHFNIVHGQAVGLMLPAVIRFNLGDDDARRLYAKLAVHARLIGPDAAELEAVAALLERITALLDAAQIPTSLEEAGANAAMIPTLAAEAAGQWTANFNPRAVTADDFAKLYEQSFARRTAEL